MLRVLTAHYTQPPGRFQALTNPEICPEPHTHWVMPVALESYNLP
jgi:hypothetical protein